MIILWQKDITWEKDYIIIDLFKNKAKIIEFNKNGSLPDWKKINNMPCI